MDLLNGHFWLSGFIYFPWVKVHRFISVHQETNLHLQPLQWVLLRNGICWIWRCMWLMAWTLFHSEKWMISEGSCDTEDWSNDTDNSALITGINYILKIYLKRSNKCSLLSKTELLQNFKWPPCPLISTACVCVCVCVYRLSSPFKDTERIFAAHVDLWARLVPINTNLSGQSFGTHVFTKQSNWIHSLVLIVRDASAACAY